jgi:hypothetical protein
MDELPTETQEQVICETLEPVATRFSATSGLKVTQRDSKLPSFSITSIRVRPIPSKLAQCQSPIAWGDR